MCDFVWFPILTQLVLDNMPFLQSLILHSISYFKDPNFSFFSGPKSIDFLSKLGLGRIVTCSLNPLKVCLPPVVKNFAAIARHYQLAYCETVIQRNNRLNLPVVGTKASTTSVIGEAKPALLDTFFPFDPYRLEQSKNFVKGKKYPSFLS